MENDDNYEYIQKVGKSLINSTYNGKPQNTNVQKTDILLDADALSALFVVVNTMISSGYDIIETKKNKFSFRRLFSKKRLLSDLEMVFKKSNFNLYHTQIIINAVINNIVPIQRISNGLGETDSFRIIDGDKMQPVDGSQDELGNYTKFEITTDINNGKTEIVTNEDLYVIRLYQYDNDFNGISRFEALQNILASKAKLQEFQENLILTNQFRMVWNFNDDSPNFKAKFELTKNSIVSAKYNSAKDFFTAGNVSVKPLRSLSELKEVNDNIDAYNRRINALLGVAPILAGITDGSNRSNGEIQARFAFKQNINSIQQRLSEELTSFIEWMGFDGVFIYNDYHDPKTTELVLNNFLKLQQGGVKKDKLAVYLQKNGMDIQAEDIEDIEPKLDKNSDLHPSRQKTDFDGTEVKN